MNFRHVIIFWRETVLPCDWSVTQILSCGWLVGKTLAYVYLGLKTLVVNAYRGRWSKYYSKLALKQYSQKIDTMLETGLA